jgi:hypothetical protein
MSIAGIKNKWLRRSVLIVAIVPLGIVSLAWDMLDKFRESGWDLLVSIRDAWRGRG